MAGNMAIVDEFPFPFHEPKGEELQRVFAGYFGEYRSAVSFAARFGVDELKITKELSRWNLWGELLTELAKLGRVRAAVKALRDEPLNNKQATFLDLLLAEESAPILFENEIDPYEYFGWFDRIDERDLLAQALIHVAAPPKLNPIVMGILAEVADEHPLFIPRLKAEVLNGIHPQAAWPDDYILWAKSTDVTAEYEMLKIARKKFGDSEARKLKMDGPIEKLGKALAGRGTRFEIRVEDFQRPDMRKKLEDFLAIWSRLGKHSPPPVLCVVFVRYRDEDISLAEVQAEVRTIFQRAGGQLIAVPPVMLSACDASHFEGWQLVLNEMRKPFNQKAYNDLKIYFSAKPFRLRELIERAKQSINF
jgi:hypothetical protein